MGHYLFPITFAGHFDWSTHPGVILVCAGIGVMLLFGALFIRKFK